MENKLFTLGSLTTLWAPPASCLSTTTKWGDTYRALFMGYHSKIGVDANCFPSHRPDQTGSPVTSPLIAVQTTTSDGTPTTLATITGYTTFTPTPTGTFKADPLLKITPYALTPAYYSPGICPSGYTYAASHTTEIWENIWHRTGTDDLDPTRYICCPSGYSVYSAETSRRQTGNLKVTETFAMSYSYPECTRSTTSLSNVWSMTPGWPTTKPSSYALEYLSGESYNTYGVVASGVVVGWRSSDLAVVNYLRENNITPPPLPTFRIVKTVDKNGVAGTVIGCFLLLFFICCGCLCRRTKRKQEGDAVLASQGNFRLLDSGSQPFLESKTESSFLKVGTSGPIDTNITTPNVVVLGPVTNLNVTGGNVQQVINEAPPSYEPEIK